MSRKLFHLLWEVLSVLVDAAAWELPLVAHGERDAVSNTVVRQNLYVRRRYRFRSAVCISGLFLVCVRPIPGVFVVEEFHRMNEEWWTYRRKAAEMLLDRERDLR